MIDSNLTVISSIYDTEDDDDTYEPAPATKKRRVRTDEHRKRDAIRARERYHVLRRAVDPVRIATEKWKETARGTHLGAVMKALFARRRYAVFVHHERAAQAAEDAFYAEISERKRQGTRPFGD
jgi:hypothetical protein